MKKLLLFLLVTIMSLGLNAQTLYGDVNGDVTVNITDVNAVISIILDGKTMTPAADVNGDGTVNITDLNAIINVILGGGPHLSWYLVTDQGRNIAMNRVAVLTATSQYNETFKVLDKDGNLLADQVKKVSFEFLDDAVVAHESNNAVTASRAPGQDGSPIPSYKFLLSYQQDNQMFHESPEIITFQTDGNGHFSWNSSTSTAYDSARDISELDYVTRSATSSVKLPDDAPLSPGDIYIVGNDGYVIDVQQDGTFTTVADYLLAMDENGNTLYLSYANSDVNDNMQVVTLDSRETALALVLPILPNIFETMSQEHLNKLKDIFWDVPEVKALAQAIDESIVNKGYLDMDYVDNAYQTAYNRLVVLLHLDTTYLSGGSTQMRGNSVGARHWPKAAADEPASAAAPQHAPQQPLVVYPYNRGVQLVLNDARYLNVEATPPVDDVMTASKFIWQCDFELRNSNSFAYTSVMQGRLGPGGERFDYVYDEPYEIAIFLNILKAQKVSSFLDTFTSVDGVIEDLGNIIDETWKLLTDSEYFFDEMTWDNEIKKVTFNMTTNDDIVVVAGPRDNSFVLGYNILKVAVEPILKMVAKKLLKGKGETFFEEKILIPFLTDFFFKMATDTELKAKYESIIYDQSLSNKAKIMGLADLMAPKLFDFVLKEVYKIADKEGKEAIQEMFTNMAKKYDKENYDSDSQGDFYDNVLLSEGELENISYEELWSEVKMVFKWLDIIEKVGDATTGFLGLFEPNRTYEINLDFGDQLILSDYNIVMPPDEKLVHIEMGKRVYDLENDNPALVSVEKSPGIKGTYLKITRNDVNMTGMATITVADRLLNKQALIHVSVGDGHEMSGLSISPSQIDFGVVEYGTDKTSSLTVTNTSNETVTITVNSDPSFTDYFEVSSDNESKTLAPWSSMNYTVTAHGTKTGCLAVTNLLVSSGDGEPQLVALSSRGMDSDPLLDVSSVSLNTGERTVVVARAGNCTVTNSNESVVHVWKSGGGSGGGGRVEPPYLSSATSSESRFSVEALSNGTATVVITDEYSGQKGILTITVGEGGTDNHEWVDLGLPSGTLWATCNVGANSPEEYGDYFAWGETEPKDYYATDWSDYKWCNGDYNQLTKYCVRSDYGYNGFVDNKKELDPEDDAAYVNWGPSWRMPTTEQQCELYENCSSDWTTQNGVNGRLFTGPNGNTMFLPAAGYRWCASLYDAGSWGYYWSRTLFSILPIYAYGLDFYSISGGVYKYYFYRGYGQPVRAVRVTQN